jgi:hypothetical protein
MAKDNVRHQRNIFAGFLLESKEVTAGGQSVETGEGK